MEAEFSILWILKAHTGRRGGSRVQSSRRLQREKLLCYRDGKLASAHSVTVTVTVQAYFLLEIFCAGQSLHANYVVHNASWI